MKIDKMKAGTTSTHQLLLHPSFALMHFNNKNNLFDEP